MSPRRAHRVLIVDDNPDIHELLRKVLVPSPLQGRPLEATEAAVFGAAEAPLEAPQIEVDSAFQGQEGLLLVERARAEGRPYALAFIDMRMPPGWDGIQTISHLWTTDPELQMVICTAVTDLSIDEITRQFGRTDRLLILKKPFDNIEVRQLASALTQKWSLARQVQIHMDNLHALVQERTRALETSLSLVRATLDATADGILVVDRDVRVVNFNQPLLRIFKLPFARPEGAYNDKVLDALLPQLKLPRKLLRLLHEPLNESDAETSGVLEMADGRLIEHCWHPQQAGSEIIGRVWSFRDITERKHAEEKLLLLAHSMESIREMAVITDLEDRITFVNQACLDKFGYKREELIGQHFSIFHSSRTPADIPMEVARVSRCGSWRGEMINKTKEGREFLVDLSASPVLDDSGKIIGLVGIADDITEQKHAEQALRASENHYRLLFEHNPSPIYVYDQVDLRFLSANQAAVRHYGYSNDEFLSMTLADIALPEEVPVFVAGLSRLDARPDNPRIWRHRKKDGRLMEMEITSHSLVFPSRKAWLSLAIDVTERLSLEAQLRQSQKMESVGQLAGGIAHDFNNLLTVITGHAGLLLAKESFPSQVTEPLKEISEAAKRAADLTRQLLAFSRKQVLNLQVVDLNEVVKNVSKMLRRILGEDITLNATFSPHLPSVKADLSMLEQVLLNLSVNSRDAMPKGGQLHITTTSVMIDAAYAQQNPESLTGRYVCLTFSDTGCGIPEDNLPRIFEPFFTTKELDRGTGLGLATVYGIIKQHQGWIKVTSQVQEGTTFQIFLPSSTDRGGRMDMPAVEQRVIGGTETILVVEDEIPLLKLVHHILEGHGYKVLEATSGIAALKVWEENSAKIDLLLSDLILPDGMAGPELGEILQASKPSLKIIYTSGYDTSRISKEFEIAEGVTFIQKPFHARKLAETVYDCLNGS